MSNIQPLYKRTQRIRGFINHPRRRHALVRDNARWFKLTSSLDVIEDTDLAIQAFSAGSANDADGEVYLAVYGLLQALVLQQDAVQHLCESLMIREALDKYPKLVQIREVRNDSVGHPTQRRSGTTASFHYISRATLTRGGFELLSSQATGSSTFKRIQIRRLIEDQQKHVLQMLDSVIDSLEQEDTRHREMYKTESLEAIFVHVEYACQNILSGVSGSSPPALIRIGGSTPFEKPYVSSKRRF